MLEYLTWITASVVFVSTSFFSDTKLPDKELQVSECLTQQSAVKAIKSFDKIKVEAPSAYKLKNSKAVNTALKTVAGDNIWQTLNHLTSYSNRSATKETGVAAATWLKNTFEEMALNYGRTDTRTFFVKTGWYKQPSVVTVIGKDIKAPAIVIGAHMDTFDGNQPGADEGSGAASIMETARVLLASKTRLKNPVYIVWYAAGNRNLAGSQYVVEYFLEQSIPVKAVLQLDKVGYRVDSSDATMWVYSDYTDSTLSKFTAKLITTYLHVPVDYSRCGYECSDHNAWSAEGMPAAFSTEASFENLNPYIGSPSDTMNLLNLEHMVNFSKLALAFVIELGS